MRGTACSTCFLTGTSSHQCHTQWSLLLSGKSRMASIGHATQRWYVAAHGCLLIVHTCPHQPLLIATTHRACSKTAMKCRPCYSSPHVVVCTHLHAPENHSKTTILLFTHADLKTPLVLEAINVMLGLNAMQRTLVPVVNNLTAVLSAQSAGPSSIAAECRELRYVLDKADVATTDPRYAAWLQKCRPLRVQVWRV